jgi:predicted transposase YdaD
MFNESTDEEKARGRIRLAIKNMRESGMSMEQIAKELGVSVSDLRIMAIGTLPLTDIFPSK